MDLSQFTNIPVIPPPPGVTSNFVNPYSRAPIIRAFTAICLILIWPVFLLRLYSKVFVTRKFGWDDVTSSIAVIGVTIMSAFAFWALNALGPRGWDIPISKVTPMLLEVMIFADVFSSNILAFFTKTSLLLLYLQVFAPKVWFRYAVYIGIVVCGLVCGGCATAIGALCIAGPGESWYQSTTSLGCAQGSSPVTILTGVFALVSDLYLLVLPIPIIWHLHLSTRKRIGIAAVFSTGILAIASSASGIYFRVAVTMSNDKLWEVTPAILLAIIELSAGILCASMPYLPAVFRKAKGSKGSKSSTSYRPFRKSDNSGSGSEDQVSVFQQHKAKVDSRGDQSYYEAEYIKTEHEAQQVV